MLPLIGQIIDVWMQHPTPRLGAEPMFESLRRWVPSTQLVPCVSVPLATTIDAMDAAGVRLGLVCAWWGPRGPLIDNDEVAALVRERPDRLIGVASVDLARPMAAVRELRRAVRELGFRALRILPWLWNLPPDDRRYYPLYAECIELDIPVCLQVGHTGPLAPSEPGRPIPYLDHVALDFPDLRIVGGHIGFPWTSEMISPDKISERPYRHFGLQGTPVSPRTRRVHARPWAAEGALRLESSSMASQGLPRGFCHAEARRTHGAAIPL